KNLRKTRLRGSEPSDQPCLSPWSAGAGETAPANMANVAAIIASGQRRNARLGIDCISSPLLFRISNWRGLSGGLSAVDLMSSSTLFVRLARGFGFSLRFWRRAPVFTAASFPFALSGRACSRCFLCFLRLFGFLCFLGFLRGLCLLGTSGLSSLSPFALVGADFCRTRVFILERVGVGGSDDAPGLGVVRQWEEQKPAGVLERAILEVWLDPAVGRIEEQHVLVLVGRGIDDIARPEMPENPIELGHVDVGDARVAADEQHVLVVGGQRVL